MPIIMRRLLHFGRKNTAKNTFMSASKIINTNIYTCLLISYKFGTLFDRYISK